MPLHYALAPNELQVDRETLEKEFLGLAEAEGVSDIEELNRILEKAVTLKNMLKNRDRVEKVAAYVAQYFRENVEPMGYKAFLVAVDREACCLYKEALDRFLPPEYSTVVISQTGKKDREHIKRHFTGFDAPILYSLYLDKPMRDHVLLQTIARVNRPFEDGENRRKPCGFILDFVGIFDKLERALAFDSKDVSDVFKAEVGAWAKRIGVRPKEIHIRPMKRKWGSCSTHGRLTFDVDLLRQHAEFRKRVIVEELLHLRVPNHGKLFRSLLSAHPRPLPQGERGFARGLFNDLRQTLGYSWTSLEAGGCTGQ